jgi:hypothetical protein
MTCPNCARLEAECGVIAEMCANISAALLGQLPAGVPYAGKPAAPVEEALQVRRGLMLLAEWSLRAEWRGKADVEEKDALERIEKAMRVAKAELPVAYGVEPPPQETIE